jgi:hypothetical protein
VVNAVQELSATISGSGIRISPYSLNQQRASGDGKFADFRYDAYRLTLQGLAEVLETTPDVVRDLHSSCQYAGDDQTDKIIEGLPPDVRLRVKERLSFK